MLAEPPVRHKHFRVVLRVFDRLLHFMKLVESRDEFGSGPVRGLFDPSQLPLPQGILPGEPAEHNRHLEAEEHPKNTEHNDQRREEQRRRLSGNEQADDCDENRVGHEIIGEHRVVVPDSGRPECDEMIIGHLAAPFSLLRHRAIGAVSRRNRSLTPLR